MEILALFKPAKINSKTSNSLGVKGSDSNNFWDSGAADLISVVSPKSESRMFLRGFESL